jgi:hypothetical protein
VAEKKAKNAAMLPGQKESSTQYGKQNNSQTGTLDKWNSPTITKTDNISLFLSLS